MRIKRRRISQERHKSAKRTCSHSSARYREAADLNNMPEIVNMALESVEVHNGGQNRGMIFTNDVGEEYQFEQEGLNVWRSHFDGRLAKKAKESGAEVRDGVSVLSCTEQDGFVEVSLHGENNYMESAKFRYFLCAAAVVEEEKDLLPKMIKGVISLFPYISGKGLDRKPYYLYNTVIEPCHANNTVGE